MFQEVLKPLLVFIRKKRCARIVFVIEAVSVAVALGVLFADMPDRIGFLFPAAILRALFWSIYLFVSERSRATFIRAGWL